MRRGLRISSRELADRFDAALYFPGEAHMDAMAALDALLADVRGCGVDVQFGTPWHRATIASIVIDCRGMAARDEITELRGVRGERIIVRAKDVTLQRPVRLLHPRQPIYVVPQGDGRFVIGATVIEREDAGPVTVRSALGASGFGVCAASGVCRSRDHRHGCGRAAGVCRQHAAHS